MRRLAVLAAIVSMSVAAVIAQKQEMPTPGLEHQRLGAFVGNWAFEGELKPGPMGPGGKTTSTERIEWGEGNFFVQRNYQARRRMCLGRCTASKSLPTIAQKKSTLSMRSTASGIWNRGR